MSHTIELKNVSKYYTDEDSVSMGISRIDLALDIGEFVVITGESGSGKTTLLNVISGLDTYEEGEMLVCGEDTTAYGTKEYEIYRKTYIGSIFQNFNLINSYTVYENIELVMLLAGKSKNECKGRVNKLIRLVGLSEFTNTKVSKLSGGQKQRVSIARAIAKDAPIIVADEPTGNLDSASASSVMETLAKVSKDKLVIIVTHNYEQAEPYATRKLTMHDGRIIEDKELRQPAVDEHISVEQLYDSLEEEARILEQNEKKETVSEHQAEPSSLTMSKSSELRLGVRNTFNLPAKFILLFIVYFFVSSAVLGQYATEKNRMHESDLLGSNPYFLNTSPERIIVKKADGSTFTEKDYAAIRAIPNVGDIVKNDIALDKGVSIGLRELTLEGPLVSFSQIPEDAITYGHMPRNDYEIVIRVDATNDAYVSIANSGDEYIGDPVLICDMDHRLIYKENDIKIAGIILDTDLDKVSDYSLYGYSTIYASEALSREVQSFMIASESSTELIFGDTRLNVDYGHAVYASPKVPDGKVFLMEEQSYYYGDKDEDESILGNDFSIRISNQFFEAEGKYEVDKLITEKNCSDLVGISEDDYDDYYNSVFISVNDFRRLFSRGAYQISAFMISEQESDATQQALRENGFTTLVIKDALSDPAGDLGKVLDLMTYGRLALEFIVLFLIAYAVIRLIMRSRSSYYSTLRMLGASISNTRRILRTELILMMLIAYSAVVVLAVLINNGVLQDLTGNEMTSLSKLLFYLDTPDYSILGVLLLFMSLLISGIYSRRIFAKSAMKTFREEV